MHHRIFWLFLWALVSVVALRAQAPTPAGPATGASAVMPPGEVKAVKVSGRVSMTVDGVTTTLNKDDLVKQTAKINTENNSSVVLAFSNGATTQLGPDTELVIEEFLQDPFPNTIAVASLTDEPTTSRTRLALNHGELVGEVKHLKREKGSRFDVQTPVGAAGIRGTTFRIVFRPQGTGQAFFQLTTAVGEVAFVQPNASGSGTPAGGTATGGATPSGGTAPGNTAPTATGTGTATGVSVPQGQEISITVNVTQNAQGQMVVTVLPPPVTATVNVSVASMTAVTQVAKDIAVAVQQTVFTPATTTPSTTGTTGTTGTTTGTTKGTSSDSTGTTTPTTTETPTPTPTTTTTTVSGQNFTAKIDVTPQAPVQPARIVTNPGGTPGG